MAQHPYGGEVRRQYQVVADRVRVLIRDGAYLAGARLPGERELAQQLGVSRPSLREALIALEIEGRIEIRGGSGVYVCAAPEELGATPTLGESPAELMHARVVVESAVVTLAAARVDKASLDRVRDALEAMRADVAAGRKPVEADRRFHVSIAEMSGNLVLAGVVGTLFDGRHGAISTRMSGRIESVTPPWRDALDEHEAILRALESRDPQAASAAMCRHLFAAHDRWVGVSD
ncbi:transcriptional regulator, GntR family [Mitsuaria sp. PDC51]|uniref:FadR/GntR family transcriptional regulator n=1 Tax=Mitsuaria sp. PDC51 TaxID=1881035 RepID=UPI0008DEB9B3|nr:FadR/GntR family transcriptional regulator [Mitsuaria sp. PDC51]SFR80560.1 transcriptional regulator, GntR family [Mitsuaria sp. PDC51]